MSAELLRVVGVLLCAALAAVYLKQYNPEYAYLIALGAGAAVLVVLSRAAGPLISFVNTLSESVSFKYAGTLLKAAGISIAVEVAANVCRDANQSAAAYKIELAGKIAIALLAVPLFEDVLSLARELMTS